jgi:general secretion pathway protein A
MYLNHYNLNTKPFQISTDPRFLWLGEKHKEALAVLRYGILDNKGFLLLTGEVGTGKTTLIHVLINALRDDVIIANVPDPGLETMEFYAYIARAFHLSNGFKTKYEFLSMFGDFLHRSHAEKKQVLLILDESQRMEQALLEEIRMLSNIETQSTKLINIFFVGQAEFNNIILENRNRALRQRITVNYNLGSISRKETDLYVMHRLKVAGTEKRIFTSNAIKEIHAFSEGYPRLINVICDRALVTGYANGATSISRAVIKECADEMRLHKKGEQKSIAAVTRKEKEPSLIVGGKEEPRPVKPGLYVLLAVLVAAWLVITAYAFSP